DPANCRAHREDCLVACAANRDLERHRVPPHSAPSGGTLPTASTFASIRHVSGSSRKRSSPSGSRSPSHASRSAWGKSHPALVEAKKVRLFRQKRRVVASRGGERSISVAR